MVPATYAAPTRRQVLRALGLVGGAVAGGRLLTACTAQPPPAPDPFRLATGPEGAVYREIGGALAEVVDREWGREVVEVVYTEAAPENAALLTSGRAEMGFVNVDVAAAHDGELRALARVFDSVLHVVVPSGRGLRRIGDLDGLTLAAGLPRSGTRYVLERLLAGSGSTARLRAYSQADSVRAFRRGEVDAVVSLTGMPTPAVTELAEGGGVELLDLAPEVEALAQQHPLEYFSVVVPATTYPPMPSATALAVPTLLAVPPTMDDALALFLTGVLFDHADELSRVRAEASQINPRTGAATAPVPLHPGARRWFRDRKP